MPIHSNRYFTLFDFIISHSQLLLRSSKGDEFKENIDIIFFGVKFLQIPTYYDGLNVVPISFEEAKIEGYSTQIGKDKEINIFKLVTNKDSGFLACSFVQMFANNLEFNETSLGVLSAVGRESLIAEFR